MTKSKFAILGVILFGTALTAGTAQARTTAFDTTPAPQPRAADAVRVAHSGLQLHLGPGLSVILPHKAHWRKHHHRHWRKHHHKRRHWRHRHWRHHMRHDYRPWYWRHDRPRYRDHDRHDHDHHADDRGRRHRDHDRRDRRRHR